MSAIQQLLASYGAFNPLTIPSLTEWFDYRTLASVGNGNPVGSWAGSKSLYTLTQTGTARPTYASNDGDGRAAVQFDGVNDLLVATISNAALYGSTGNYEFWVVARLATVQAIIGGYFDSTGTTNQIGLAATSSSLLDSLINGIHQNATASLYDNASHVIRCSQNGAQRIIQLDGTTLFNGAVSTGSYGTGNDILGIGAYFGFYMTGSFRHWMAFNAPLDSTTASRLTSYLQSA